MAPALHDLTYNPLVVAVVGPLASAIAVALVNRSLPRLERVLRGWTPFVPPVLVAFLVGVVGAWAFFASCAASLDATPLRIEIDAPPPGELVTGDAVFRGRILGSEPADSLHAQWWMDDGTRSDVTLNAGEWNIRWTANDPGREHTFHILAWDDLGRSAKAQLTFTFRPPAGT